MNTSPNISINKEKTSPYWMVSFIGADGKQKRRSTKVPVAGGLFEGENLTRAQAEKRALIVGAPIACTENHTVNLTTQKTGTILRQPMRDSFYTWARQKFEASGSDPNALLHPTLHAASSPGHEFTLLLRAHGIGVTGEKQTGSRQRLHSIRATILPDFH